MLLTELTLLVRAYKGEVKELKDNIEETASGAWIPPVAKKTFLRPQTAKLRPYSRESARGLHHNDGLEPQKAGAITTLNIGSNSHRPIKIIMIEWNGLLMKKTKMIGEI